MSSEGGKGRKISEDCGFQDLLTPGDIIKDNAHKTAFRQLTAEAKKLQMTELWRGRDIESVFVFADRWDWAGEQQIILDLYIGQERPIGYTV